MEARLGGWLVAIGLLALKFGKGLFLLLKGVKLFTTAGTMLISVVAYSFIWGWKFALGFVLLLLVHEMGHVIQLRREGQEASAPMFIPFMGAVVFAKLDKDATAEARVGLAGPVLGTLGTLALLPIAINTGDDFWYALIFTGLFLNLFNLLPLVPLDGGRAMAALSPKMWIVGFIGAIVLAVRVPEPDHAPDPAARRLRDLPPLEGAQDADAGGAGVLHRQAVASRRDRGGLPRADRRLRHRHGSDAHRARHPVLTPAGRRAR